MIFEGICKDLANDGKGIVEYENKVVLVDNLLVGEKAKIEIYNELSRCSYGKVVELITRSPDRKEAICPYYEKCGGCQLMHLNYEKQLDFKKEQIKKAFKRIANIDIDVETPLFSIDLGYRNKIELPVESNKLGFYKNGTKEIIPIINCKLVDNKMNDLIKIISDIIETVKPDIKHIIIKRSYKLDQTMLIVVSKENDFSRKKEFFKKIIDQIHYLTTLIHNVNKSNHLTMSNTNITIMGKGYIEDIILDNKFIVSASSFYQVNAYQTEVLYATAIKLANISKKDIVLDAYCGVGTIGILTSKYAKKVYGVEINKDAIKDAKKNAQLNKIENIEFVCDDAKRFLKTGAKDANVLIMDPTRAGADKEFLNLVIERKFEKIVYISCDYKTQARDIKLLEPYYQIKEVQPVEMFPNTYHIENVALLCLKDAKK